MLPPALAQGASPRIACLDYALAETLIALGRPPVAVANARGWDMWVGAPALDPGTIDLGIDLDVNLELLAQIAPDIILTTDYVSAQEDTLSRIAPVHRLTIYDGSQPPLARSLEVTRDLAQIAGIADGGSRYMAETQAAFDALAARVSRLDAQAPLLLVVFMDQRHVRVFGQPGLYDDVLTRLGLSNAWRPRVNDWGFTTVGVEALSAVGPAHLVVVEPVPPDALATLAHSPLWTSLPFVRAGTMAVVPPALMFGAVPAARRFAGLIVDALETGA